MTGWRKEVSRWTAQWREAFEERAAIREFDGGQNRSAAEFDAYREVRDQMHSDQEARRA
jgi:hypothetical protein